jgi:hypothetical protein
MIRISTLAVAALALAPIAAGAQACTGPDLALTSLRVQSVAKGQYLNSYQIAGIVTNLGASAQSGDVLQFVDINQYGHRLDDRGVPPLGPGQSYTVTYVWKRAVDAGDWTTPLSFHIRPVTPSASQCSSGKDSQSIQF